MATQNQGTKNIIGTTVKVFYFLGIAR